jgi:excisionase family DNA binding protein
MAEQRQEPRPVLIPAREVARRLSIAVRTLYRLVQRGQMPRPIRFNRKLVLWRTDQIELYLKKLEGPTP